MWPNLPRSCYFLKILIIFTKTHRKRRDWISIIINLWMSEFQTKQTMESSKYTCTRFALFVFFYILVVDFFWIQHLCLYLYPSTFTKFHLKCLFKCVKISSSQSSFAYETFHLTIHIYYTMFWTSFKNTFGCV